MCGVPIERADEYLHRLIALGHRVAVCEQLEDPAEARKRGGKSIVRRDVVRLVTPGTLTEDSLLDARRNNYLVAIARAKPSADGESRFALAFLDISTGEFRLAECDRTGLSAELARLEPGEIIVSDALYGDGEVAPLLRTLPVTPLGRDVFDGATAERRLGRLFRGRDHRRVRRALASRAHRRRRLHHLCGAHPDRQAPAALAADAGGRRRDARDRRRDAGKSRADADAERRAPRLARSPRSTAPSPSPARGCCRSGSPRRSPIPPRSRAGSMPSSCSPRTRCCARTSARGSPRRPTSPVRSRGWCSAAAARATSPRSATASKPRPACRRGSPRCRRRPRSPRRWRRCGRPDRGIAAELAARSPTSCRF